MDMAWLAGILEGEGCFDGNRNGDPRVRLEMTDKDVVERAHSLMGGRGKVRTVSRTLPHNTTYQISVSGGAAADLLEQIRPFMGSRRGTKIDALLLNWQEK